MFNLRVTGMVGFIGCEFYILNNILYIQYFSVKINTDMKASSFNKDQKVNKERISIKI